MNKYIDDVNHDYVNNNQTYRTNRAERSHHSSWAPNFIVGVADLAVEGTSKIASQTDLHQYISTTTHTMELKSSQNDFASSQDTDLMTVPFVPRTTTNILDNLKQNTDDSEDKVSCLGLNNVFCLIVGRWWNVRYHCQRQIIEFVDKAMFHMFIIVFVLIDCFLVIAELMFDFIKLQKPCHAKTTNSTKSHNEEDHQLELIIEILHYSSLALLTMFLIEVLIKMYAFGRQWWDFHQKKMEWLDAIIVIVSFIIDLIIMNKTNLVAEISLLFISIRLWRFIRIINSVAQSIRTQDEAKKEHVASTYIQVIELLLTISEKKTITISELCHETKLKTFENFIEKFTRIDQQCRYMIEHCPRPSSLNSVTDISHHLQHAIEQVRRASLTMNGTDKNEH